MAAEMTEPRRPILKERFFLDLDLALAVAGTQAIAPRAVRRAALEQSDVVDALEAAFVALLIHDRDPLGVRKEDAHERHVAFDMGAEIAERVGLQIGRALREHYELPKETPHQLLTLLMQLNSEED
jgi:hypothetical protein